MANASIHGVKCPRCKEDVSVRADCDPGEPSYSGYDRYDGAGYPGSPPEITDIEEYAFECDHDLPHMLEKVGKWRRVVYTVRGGTKYYSPARPVYNYAVRKVDPASRWFWKLIDKQVETLINAGEFTVDEPDYPEPDE